MLRKIHVMNRTAAVRVAFMVACLSSFQSAHKFCFGYLCWLVIFLQPHPTGTIWKVNRKSTLISCSSVRDWLEAYQKNPTAIQHLIVSLKSMRWAHSLIHLQPPQAGCSSIDSYRTRSSQMVMNIQINILLRTPFQLLQNDDHESKTTPQRTQTTASAITTPTSPNDKEVFHCDQRSRVVPCGTMSGSVASDNEVITIRWSDSRY